MQKAREYKFNNIKINNNAPCVKNVKRIFSRNHVSISYVSIIIVCTRCRIMIPIIYSYLCINISNVTLDLFFSQIFNQKKRVGRFFHNFC